MNDAEQPGKDTHDAAQALAGESTQLHPALGEFIGCTISTCSHGEWTSKARERGWLAGKGHWLCPEHVAFAQHHGLIEGGAR